MIILVFALYLSFIIYIAIGLLRLPKEKPLACCNENVTVVMAVKNESKCIKNCLNDFLNQTYKNVEFIIVDDNSTDETYNFLLNYSQKYNYIKVIKNTGKGKKSAKEFNSYRRGA